MRPAALLNALLLFLFALLLLAAAITPLYEQFMHPRFRLLTLSAAYILLALAVVVLLGKSGPVHPLNYLVLSIVFGLLGAAFVVHFPERTLPGVWTDGTAEILPSSWDEEDSVLISIPEIYLYTLDESQPLAGRELRFRGVVLRRPDLDRRGLAAVGRVYLSCCAADAVRLIFIVELPPGTAPDQLKDGEWVTVKGRLRDFPRDREPFTTEGLTPDSFATLDVINQVQLVEAGEISPTQAPQEFFIDTLRGEEPYSY